jgi:hypothetical protein
MGLRLRFIGKMKAGVRDAMRRLIAAASEVTEIRHPLKVSVTPSITVQGPSGGVGFGCFGTCDGKPEIWMGGRPPTKWVAAWLRDVLAHELAHYEQYRDGKPLSERGVAVRTRTLSKRLKAGASGR